MTRACKRRLPRVVQQQLEMPRAAGSVVIALSIDHTLELGVIEVQYYRRCGSVLEQLTLLPRNRITRSIDGLVQHV